MSAFVVIYQRDGQPLDPGAIDGPLAALRHRGPDGCDRRLRRAAALGHQHFWTTPEEAGERQPLAWAGDGFVSAEPGARAGQAGRFDLVFDGRLDNREELLAALGRSPGEGDALSDAALVLLAYAHWGEASVARLLGPFALALYDVQTHRVLCARDALGDRTLFYYMDERVLVIASEEQALLAYPGLRPDLDEPALAQFFAARAPGDGGTLFADVRELLPAHALAVDGPHARTWRYWDVDPHARRRERSDADYAEHFRTLLDESVRRCLRAPAPPAVLMSGGLDSTAIAALAARHLAARMPGGHAPARRLSTISWVFDELAACDERPFMQALVERYGLAALQFPGDDAWPLRDAQTWPHNPNGPDGNPYRLLKTRAYQAAGVAGTRVLLTGGFGDHLYSGAEHWLADLLAEGRIGEAAVALTQHLSYYGLPGSLGTGGALLDRVPGGRRLWPRRASARPPWLTPFGAARLPDPAAWPPSARLAIRPAQHRSVLGTLAARHLTSETYFASLHGVEVRHPFRDRQLVEFMLTLPAQQLYHHAHYKYVLRNALRGILPETVRTRRRPTSLFPLFARGLVEREWATVQALCQAPDALWRPYVRADWLSRVLSTHVRARRDGPEVLVAWYCLSAALWQANRSAGRMAGREILSGLGASSVPRPVLDEVLA